MRRTRKAVFALLIGTFATVGLIGGTSRPATAIEPITLALILGAGYAALHTATGIGPGPARDGVVFGRRVNDRADFGPQQFVSRQFGAQQFNGQQFGGQQFGGQQFGSTQPHSHEDPRLGVNAPHTHFSQQFGQMAPHMHARQ